MGRVRDPQQYQSYYKLLIGGVDFTPLVEGEVRMSQGNDLITTLTFMLKDGLRVMDAVRPMQKVEFIGGSKDALNVKKVFNGVVKSMSPQLPDSGQIKVSFTCFSFSWQGARQPTTCRYPSEDCQRKFAAGKESIKASEIVNGILDTTFDLFDREVIITNDIVFTEKNAFQQTGVTDWVALRQLADLCNCVLYESVEDGSNKIHFVDVANAKKAESAPEGISFRYIGKTDQLENETFEVEELDNPMQIEIESGSMSIDANVVTDQSIRIVTNFTDEGENEKIYAVKYDEEKEEAVTYELNYKIVNSLSRSEVDNLWYKLTYQSQNVSWEEIQRFFIPVTPENKLVEGYEENAGDLGFKDAPIWTGWQLSATIIGDVNIMPYRTYPVYGLGNRYSTKKSGSGRYYIQSLEWIWSDTGFFQEIDFIR